MERAAAYTNSNIYNSVEKVKAYWDRFRPGHDVARNYIDRWNAQAAVFESISLQNRTCITVWDVVSNRFVYAVDKTNVLADFAYRFAEPDGVHFSMSNYPPGHINATLAMQEVSINYCISNPQFVCQIVMNQDLAYSLPDRIIHLMQQVMVVETDEQKRPLLFLSFLYDITHLKKADTANLVITSPDETLMWNYDLKKEKLEVVSPFTSKEKKILQLLSERRNTKQIAGALHISPHTVDTHRRNLLGKTNCVDTTALVTYCRMVGLL